MRQFRSGWFDLQTPLLDLRFIGPYLNSRLAARNWSTIGDLARWARGKTTQQVYDALSETTRNRRGNVCIQHPSPQGYNQNNVTQDYHVPDINFKGYNTLRNLLVAVRSHWRMFRRIPSNLPPQFVQRDTGTAICSCVQTRADCQTLARAGDCTWRDRRCQPRATSRLQAFRGAADLAGQYERPGRRVAGMRYRNRWRIPDNR